MSRSKMAKRMVSAGKLGFITGMTILMMACSNNTAGLRIDSAQQQVLYGDQVLAGRLNIDNIATQDSNGHTRGIVQISSTSKSDQNLQYRFYWYDDQGLEVNAKQSAWRQFILRGHEAISLSEVSINPNATQFRIQIREQD